MKLTVLSGVCQKRAWLAYCLASALAFYVLLAVSVVRERPQTYSLEPGFPLRRRSAAEVSALRPGQNVSSDPSLQWLVPGRGWSEGARWVRNVTALELSGSELASEEIAALPRCARLIEGDEKERSHAMEFMKAFVPVVRMPQDYVSGTANCTRYRLEGRFFLDALPEEKAFPLAYSILLFKDVAQVERLLRATYRPHNFYCLHVDRKADPALLNAVRLMASCLPNVFVASRLVDVTWGQFSVLEPELACMRDLWRHKGWRYFINLTGQEFPLKTNLQLVRILTALNGSNLVDCTTSQRYSDRWYNNFPAPHGIRPMKGNLHAVVNRGFVGYVLHSAVAKDFLDWLRLTEMPDESFFSSLNYNRHLGVPGAYLGPPDTDAQLNPYLARFKNWGDNWFDGLERANFNWPCYGKRVRNICIFGVGDLPMLTSRKELFANKFHLDFEPLTLQCLEEWLFNMTVEEYQGTVVFDVSFFQKLDSVKNRVDPYAWSSDFLQGRS